MEDGTCDGCFYAVPTVADDEEFHKTCRRFPPTVVSDGDGEMVMSFPDARRRCGEFTQEESEIAVALKSTLENKDEPKGAWVVYTQILRPEVGNPFPLFLTLDALEANQYAVSLNNPNARVKFWIFGEEFGTR